MTSCLKQSVACLIVVVLALATAASAQLPEPGNHFILLLDDSGDIHESHRQTMARLVPRWLFQGAEPSDPETPRFNPSTDTLSVLFFALHRESPGNQCKSAPGLVWSDEHVFEAQSVRPDQLESQASFSRALSSWLSLLCRSGGLYSPIATAPTLAPRFAQLQLDPGVMFSELFVVVVSNDNFNFVNASPSTEIDEYQHLSPPVQNAEYAKKRATEVTGLFNYDVVALASDESERIFYRVFKLSPRTRTPQAALSYDRNLEISPVAVGNARQQGVPRYAGGGSIRVYTSELVPLSMTWRVQDEANRPWGSRPTEGAVDLEQCSPLWCTRDEDHSLLVNLFGPGATILLTSVSAGPLRPGRLSFEVGFRFDSGGRVYDRLYVESETQNIAFTPSTPPSAGLLLFRPTIDHRLQSHLFSSWLDSDGPTGGLTQDAAADRIQTLNVVSWLGLLIVVGFVLVRAVRTSYLCTFEPAIEWSRLADVVVDLNRPSETRLLVGSVVVVNQGKPGWLGRLWGNREQPTREGLVRLSVDPAKSLDRLGVKVEGSCPVGFLDAHGRLCLETRERVSQGRQVHVFLAEETLVDYFPGSDPVTHEVTLTAECMAELNLEPSEVAKGASFSVSTPIRFNVRIKPEAPRPPRVSWLAEGVVEHRYAAEAVLPIGRFLVESTAERVFALPFEDNWSLLATCEGHPLSGEALTLEPPEVWLGSGEQAVMAVVLRCAAAEVINPAPSSHAYAFSLRGQYEAAFDPSKLGFALQRDQARSEIELRFNYRGHELEIFWDHIVSDWNCRRSKSHSDAVAAEFLAGILHLGPTYPFHFTRSQERRALLDVEVGNSARSGNGEVRVAVKPRLKLSDSALLRLQLQKGWSVEELVQFGGAGPEHLPDFRIKEGKPLQRGSLMLCNDAIERIHGAEVGADQCSVEVLFDIKIVPDAGETEDRLLQVSIPMHMEQLPGRNWLVLDLGTSAIAAAIGAEGENNHSPLVDLQKIEVSPNTSLSTYDKFNQEKGTPFLPSCVFVDGDLRSNATPGGRALPPGFPGHTGMVGAAQGPPSASYVALPATSGDMVDKPERVIYSLKSWLGANGSEVIMPAEIACDGRLTRRLPLDKMVVSALTALVEAYLLHATPAASAEQVVVCHPNNFTFMHRSRLKRLACDALLKRLPIFADKHVHLVSESDAVAYAYCWDRMAGEPRSGPQKLLVYDMGAGTLDLSFVDLEWSREPFYPIVRGRHHLGVAVAGHYFDEVLARIVHDTLETAGVLSTPAVQYRHRVVAEPSKTGIQVPQDSGLAQARAVKLLWDAIRQAKVEWDGQGRFDVVVGSAHESRGIVDYDTNRGNNPLPNLPAASGDPPRLFLRQTDIVLSLPGGAVTGHARMQALLKFVTADVVDELLVLAGVEQTDVDTVVISGRGAQWPGLSEALRSRMRGDSELVSFENSDAMKAAVARGAIARQTLLTQFEDDQLATDSPRLALVYGHGKGIHAVFEEEWSTPVKIPGGTFRLVQVALKTPDPAIDLSSGSLRRFFYVDVARHEYSVRDYCGPDHLLTLIKDNRGGATSIRMRRSDGVETPVAVGSAGASLRPRWPVGTTLLAPDDAGA